MKRTAGSVVAVLAGLGLLFWTAAPAAMARPAAQQEHQQQPAYTLAEYNAYQQAASEKNPQQRLKLLDDFVEKFPKSTLLPYVYALYVETYRQLNQQDKVIVYADKLIENANSLDPQRRPVTVLQALYAREVAFNMVFNEKAPDAAQQAERARDLARQGLQMVQELKKPANVSEEQFNQARQQMQALFDYTAGVASLFLKDYRNAQQFLRAALNDDPKNAVTWFRLGIAYLQDSPPQWMNGFWALARAIALKTEIEPQVRSYLRQEMLLYQKPACQNLLDDEMNQLLQAAAASQSAEAPADLKFPSADDLAKYLQDSNLFTIMQDLQAGGDKAHLAWLAACGNEFPDVPVKIIDITPTADGAVLRVYAGSTPEDIQKATTANMEVKVTEQPDAQRLHKDDIVRFTGTLVSYDPPPSFLLHWDKAKVNPEDIPPATGPRRRGSR